MLTGIIIGFAAGVLTAHYAPRVWARILERVDRVTDTDDTGTGL